MDHGGPAGAAGVEQEVALHPTRGQVVRLVVPTAAAWSALLAMVARGGVSAPALVAMALAAAASVGALAGGLGRRGLLLTRSAAVVIGRRRRAVPWEDVTAVRVRRRALSQVVVLATASGDRACPAPLSGPVTPDRHFDEKVVFIQRWWRACSHPRDDGTPRPGGGDTGWGHRVLPGEVDATGGPPVPGSWHEPPTPGG